MFSNCSWKRAIRTSVCSWFLDFLVMLYLKRLKLVQVLALMFYDTQTALQVSQHVTIIALLPSRFKFVRTLDYCDDGECRAVVDTGQSVGGQVPTGELRWRVRVRCWTFKIIGSTGLNINNIINVYIYTYIWKGVTCLGGILDITTISMLLPGFFTSNVDGVPGTSLLAVPEDFAEQLQQESAQSSQSSNSELSTAELPTSKCVNMCHELSWSWLVWLVSHWLPHWTLVRLIWIYLNLFDTYLTHCLAKSLTILTSFFALFCEGPRNSLDRSDPQSQWRCTSYHEFRDELDMVRDAKVSNVVTLVTFDVLTLKVLKVVREDDESCCFELKDVTNPTARQVWSKEPCFPETASKDQTSKKLRASELAVVLVYTGKKDQIKTLLRSEKIKQ